MKLAKPRIVAVLTLAVVVSAPIAVTAVNATCLQQETVATAAAQNPTAVEASLGPDRPARPARGSVQQGLRSDGVDPETVDRLFGPRTQGRDEISQDYREALLVQDRLIGQTHLRHGRGGKPIRRR